MGRKLDALFGRKFKASKLKLTVNLAISRLSILKNQRHARFSVARSDVIQLLILNHHEHALLRVDQVIKDQNMFDVYVMIEGYCHMLKQKVNLIEQQRVCPDELEEAASSLLYAAPRCGEFPELQEIRAILTARFGKEFAYGAIELQNNRGVSQEIIQKLSPRQSGLESRMKMLGEIAMENGVVLQLEEPSPEIKKEKMVVEQKQNQPKVEDDLTVLPKEIEEILSFSESMKGRSKYRDVADAAQVAFESAAYAAAAAKAAVELYRLESFNSDSQDSPNSRPREVLSSKSMESKHHMGDRKSPSQMGHEKSHSNPKYDYDSESEMNGKDDFYSSDSDGYSDVGNIRSFHLGQSKPMERKIVFDGSNNEIENEQMDFSSRNYDLGSDTKRGSFGNEIFYSAKDYNILEGHNRSSYSPSHKHFPFRHQANLKAESGPGNPESRFGEGSKMQ